MNIAHLSIERFCACPDQHCSVPPQARAQESLWELEGPGDGVPSAEMTATQLEHIDETNHAVGSAISFNSLKNIFQVRIRRPCPMPGPSKLNDSPCFTLQEVSRACSKLRHSVAYLGPPATYTHQAARTRFGINAAYIQVERIPDVFHAVEKGKAEFGVAPVENSTEGAISQTLDLLATTELQVVAEVTLDIRHYLLSHAELNRVQKVYSHPQALAQCRAWLTSNVPGAEIIAESSTARSALMAAQADPIEGIAAVSSYLASELYNVPVKASSIQDLSSNMTRFVVVRKQHPGGLPESEPTGDDKTMLVLNISDRVGALHEILNIIQQHSINLARIESRPSKSKVGAPTCSMTPLLLYR
jgi:chorismate mutase/prephenate dehydratase